MIQSVHPLMEMSYNPVIQNCKQKEQHDFTA
jgi:hypothetical protein